MFYTAKRLAREGQITAAPTALPTALPTDLPMAPTGPDVLMEDTVLELTRTEAAGLKTPEPVG